MAGLLGGVLPAIYSGADQLKRQVYGLLTNPQEIAQRAGQSLLQSHNERQALMSQAFGDPTNPTKVTNPQALSKLGSDVLAGELGFAPAGITTYHASPYKFSNFDPTKVGTGEGAQSYGVGAGYVAQNPKVANEYFKAFTNVEDAPLMFKGKRVDTPWNEDISQRWADVIEKNKFKPEQIEDFQGVLGNLSQVNTMQDVPSVVRGFTPSQKSIYEKYVKPELTKPESLEAYMYKVDVPDEVLPKMLDWDKPLVKQTKEVQDALKKLGISTDAQKLNEFDDALLQALFDNEKTKHLLPKEPINPTGAEIYQRFVGGSPESVSQKLKDVGITGIKYLDAFSRGDMPNPTYNFVPFDPAHMNILETTKGLLGK